MSASSAQAIFNASNAAQLELSQLSAQERARRSDPLWYRFEDPLQSIAADTFMCAASGSGVLPEQVELVEAALANNHMSRSDVTPQAFACLLEQARRYALELMADAQDYAYSANRHDVLRADLVLAAELRADQPIATATQQPKLFQLAQQVNRKPLPPIPTHCYNGVVLPPKEYQLTARTFDVLTGAQVAQRMVAPPPAPPASRVATSKPSYGASRGRQIPIQLSKSERPSAATPGSATATATTPMSTTTTSTAATAMSTTTTATPATTAAAIRTAATTTAASTTTTAAPTTAAPTTTAQGVAVPPGEGGTKRKANEM